MFQWSPSCACCTPAACTTTFHVEECNGFAVGAFVVVKTSSGVTVASGTTNSSGDVSLNLAGYVGQTLYATVTFNTNYFEIATGVLLGNFCGRLYSFQLKPKIIYGSTCGSISITTTKCDGVTLLPGRAWTLQKASAGGFANYASGTTDLTTATSTITGLTYGGAFDGYRFLVTDAIGTVTGTSILLTNTNCAASVTMRMAILASSPCSTPQDTITYSGGTNYIVGVRQCCTVACSGVTMPPYLNVSDPSMNLDKTCNDVAGLPSLTAVSGTAQLIGAGGCTWTQGQSFSSDGRNPQTNYYVDLSIGSPVLKLYAFYSCSTTQCQGLYGANQYFCACQPPANPGCCAFVANYHPAVSGIPGYWFPVCQLDYTLSATSWTCTPFSATFTAPAIPLIRVTGASGVVYLPSRTITITE